MNAVSFRTKVSVLKTIGFSVWREDDEGDWEDLWCQAMAGKRNLPREGSSIGFGFFATMYIGRKPEQHPDGGFYFVIGICSFDGKWEVFPPKEKIKAGRKAPLYSWAYAICLLDRPPESWTEEIRVTEIVEAGVVRGEYFEPASAIFKDYCTTA